ncbi:MAG: NupC/NupG family nucleoside CNT transporter [Deltaproteobacteria bacterium]|nr:NupC/NupG family nucleoside CNT transporter [Deltaproteobacteria bacterium]
MYKIIPLLGLVLMVAFAYGISTDRKNIAWRTVLGGIAGQVIFGLFILKTKIGLTIFEAIKTGFQSILDFSLDGAKFIFGPLADMSQFGFIFGVIVPCTIIFTSALMSILYHIGLMEKVVKLFARVMMKLMRTSGAESLSAAANIFAGQTEAPLVILPYLKNMTNSELMALMTGGMATVAGGVLAAYVGLGIDAGHLLAASVMSAPAALAIAKLMVPETGQPATAGTLKVSFPKNTENIIDAAVSGTSDGLKLALNVVAMLIAFIALIALINGLFSWVGGIVGHPEFSFELVMGYLFAPVAFLLGIPWNESLIVGNLIGKKLVLNEFVAYLDLKEVMGSLSERSVIISTYALCGFANFSSIAIQVGGIGALVPERRKDLARLGIKSLIAGTLACLMTAAIASILI